MKYEELHKKKQEEEFKNYTFYPNMQPKETAKKYPSNQKAEPYYIEHSNDQASKPISAYKEEDFDLRHGN